MMRIRLVALLHFEMGVSPDGNSVGKSRRGGTASNMLNIAISKETTPAAIDAFVAAIADPINTVVDVSFGVGVTTSVCERLMTNVTTVAGKLSMILTEVDDTTTAFAKLTKIGSLEVDQNPQLTSLVFARLLAVEGSAAITKNLALVSIVSAKLQNVYGSLRFEGLALFESISMPELVSVSTQISFVDCPVLSSVCNVGAAGAANPPDVGGIDIEGSPRLVRGNTAFLAEGGVELVASCEGVDVIIETQADYEALQQEHGKTLGIARVVGNIKITWADIVEVQLSTLLGRVSITNGGIIIDGCNQLTTLEVVFDDLLTVGGELRVSNNARLESVTLPKLATVGSVLSVQQNGRVTKLDIQALVRVGATLLISGEPALSSTARVPGFLLNSLEYVGGLAVKEMSGISEIVLPALMEVKEGFVVDTLFNLRVLIADSLGTIGAGLTLKGTSLLSTISMAKLSSVGGALEWVGLRALSSVSMPMLSSAGSVSLSGLDALESLCGLGLASGSVAGDVQILGAASLLQGPEVLLVAEGVDDVDPCPAVPGANEPNSTDVWYNTTTVPFTTEPICMQCCPIPAYSFTPETYGFSVAGAFVLGSMFGLIATFCCITHSRTETNVTDDLIRKNNNELMNLASQGYQMNQLNDDIGRDMSLGLGGMGEENDIIY